MRKLILFFIAVLLGHSQAGIFMYDTFTGTEGADLVTAYRGELQGNWVRTVGVTGTAEIASNRLRVSANNGFAVWRSSAVPTSADYSATADLRAVTDTGGLTGIGARVQHDGDGYFALFSGWHDGWTLWKRVSGSLTQLGSTSSATLTDNTDYTVTVDCSGSTIRLLTGHVLGGAAGTQLISVTDTDITGPGTVGILIEEQTASDTTGRHIDRVYAEQSGADVVRSTHIALGFDGDSIFGDYAREGTPTFAQVMTTRFNSPVCYNFSVPSQSITDAQGDESTQVTPVYALTSGFSQRVLFVLLGVNDCVNGSSASTINTNLRAYHATARAAGWKTVGFAIFKATSVNAGNETIRSDANIALNADTTFCDWWIDAVTLLGTPPNANFEDGVHLSATGVALLADYVEARIKPLPQKQSHFFTNAKVPVPELYLARRNQTLFEDAKLEDVAKLDDLPVPALDLPRRVSLPSYLPPLLEAAKANCFTFGSE